MDTDIIYVNKPLYEFMFKNRLLNNESNISVLNSIHPFFESIGLSLNDFNDIDKIKSKILELNVEHIDAICHFNHEVGINLLNNIDNFIDKILAYVANNREDDYENEHYITFRFDDKGKLVLHGFNIIGRKKKYLIIPTDVLIVRYYEHPIQN